MTINPIHYRIIPLPIAPPNSPESLRAYHRIDPPYDDKADESESDDFDIERVEGKTKPIPISQPQPKPEWANIHFGD